MAAIGSLELQLRLASSNSTALQRQQARLLESVHTLIHMVTTATGPCPRRHSRSPHMSRGFLRCLVCLQGRRHRSSCGGTVQMFTRLATPSVGCTTSTSATDPNLCRYDPPEL